MPGQSLPLGHWDSSLSLHRIAFLSNFPVSSDKTYGWRFNAFFLTLAIFVDLELQQKFKFTTVPIILGHHQGTAVPRTLFAGRSI